ncbi:MAG: hypothetical protein ABIO86_19800 [Sphingomonas sp.]
MGDDFEHLTSNISPSVTGASVDLFFTDEVVTVSDPATDRVMWETDGIPTFR